MKKLRSLSLLIALPIAVFAQPAPSVATTPPPAVPARILPAESPIGMFGASVDSNLLQFSGGDTASGFILAEDNSIAVHIKNVSKEPVTLTHLGVGVMGSILELPTWIELKPNAVYKTSILLQAIGEQPTFVGLSVLCRKDGSKPQRVICNGSIQAVAANKIAISNGWLMWMDGGSPVGVEKSVDILYLPQEKEIASVAAPQGWSARVDGKRIFVKPESADAARGEVTIKSKESDLGVIHVEIMKPMPLPQMTIPAAPAVVPAPEKEAVKEVIKEVASKATAKIEASK